MTPGARVAAAIEVLDGVQAGGNAEQLLTRWARSNRYAGSKDRAAVRTHVFDVLRRWTTTAQVGGAQTGRGRMIGLLAGQDVDLATVFNGEGYAPEPMSAEERAAVDETGRPEALDDLPTWLRPELEAQLGKSLPAIAELLQSRAPVFARVNLKKAGQVSVIASLNQEQIEARTHELSATALELTQNARRVAQSEAYREGWLELQDAASQAVVDTLFPLPKGARVLDYCAGGGGKALAIAAGSEAQVFAHDAKPERMRDIAARAARAGTPITELRSKALGQHAPFDLVLTDVPCSGSGAWRRQPQAKWTLTDESLQELCRIQAEILDAAADLVADAGRLVYATCSLLARENQQQIAGFEHRHPQWRCVNSRQFTPLDGGDGFFVAHLIRK